MALPPRKGNTRANSGPDSQPTTATGGELYFEDRNKAGPSVSRHVSLKENTRPSTKFTDTRKKASSSAQRAARDLRHRREQEQSIPRPQSQDTSDNHHDSNVEPSQTPHDGENTPIVNFTRNPQTSTASRAFRPKYPVTMPGSLFPRSMSLMPESPLRRLSDSATITVQRSPPSSPHNSEMPPPTINHSEGNIAGSSRSQNFNEETYLTKSVAEVPFRPPLVPSVKDAASKFQIGKNDAGPSILLPSPHVSPSRPQDRDRDVEYLGKEKGRAKQSSSNEDLSVSRERQPSSRRSSGILDVDASRESLMRGKERELTVALEEQRQHERRRDRDKDYNDAERERLRDKEKIRMLEEEIRRLKEELSKRSTSRGSSVSRVRLPPPCPPPPPPLPPPRPVRINASSSAAASESTTLFQSARAALRHTAMPTETPINDPFGLSRAKRQGRPTVNVPSEKMAAFLNEMKTVRLRKVSGTQDASGSYLGRSTSMGDAESRSVVIEPLRRSATMRNDGLSSSMREGRSAVVGDKRKRDDGAAGEFQDALHAAVRRRTTLDSVPSALASTSWLSKSDTQTTSPITAGTSSSTQSLPSSSHSTVQNKTWSSTTESLTHLTTPSLCSDDEPEPDRGGAALNNKLHTPQDSPPGSSSNNCAPAIGLSTHPQVIEIDLNDDDDGGDEPPRVPHPNRPVSSRPITPHVPRPSEFFDKRPPMSPIPEPTPRKAKPPARSRGRQQPEVQKKPENADDDPLSLSFSSPEPEDMAESVQRKSVEKVDSHQMQSRASTHRSRQPSGSGAGSSGHSRHRSTLDEELRAASARVSKTEDEAVDLESGILMGVGTRSKHKGFLAHGGAGGSPVFMGVGYVQGAEEDSGDEARRRRDDHDRHDAPVPVANHKGKRKR